MHSSLKGSAGRKFRADFNLEWMYIIEGNLEMSVCMNAVYLRPYSEVSLGNEHLFMSPI